MVILHWKGGFTNPCLFFTFPNSSPNPSFGISGDFPWFRLLGFRVIFRRSAVLPFHLLGFRGIFRRSTVSWFRLLGFGVIFRRSVIPPFCHSAVPSFRLLGSPFRNYSNLLQISFVYSWQIAFWVFNTEVLKHTVTSINKLLSIRPQICPFKEEANQVKAILCHSCGCQSFHLPHSNDFLKRRSQGWENKEWSPWSIQSVVANHIHAWICKCFHENVS